MIHSKNWSADQTWINPLERIKKKKQQSKTKEEKVFVYVAELPDACRSTRKASWGGKAHSLH